VKVSTTGDSLRFTVCVEVDNTHGFSFDTKNNFSDKVFEINGVVEVTEPCPAYNGYNIVFEIPLCNLKKFFKLKTHKTQEVFYLYKLCQDKRVELDKGILFLSVR
jgi:hypothetical protein